MSSIQTSASSSTVISSPPVAAVPTAAYSESGTSHDLWTSTSSSHAEDPNDIIDQVFIMRSKHCAFISTSSMDWGEKMVESLQSEWKYEHRISYGKDRCALKNRT